MIRTPHNWQQQSFFILYLDLRNLNQFIIRTIFIIISIKSRLSFHKVLKSYLNNNLKNIITRHLKMPERPPKLFTSPSSYRPTQANPNLKSKLSQGLLNHNIYNPQLPKIPKSKPIHQTKLKHHSYIHIKLLSRTPQSNAFQSTYNRSQEILISRTNYHIHLTGVYKTRIFSWAQEKPQPNY